VKRTPLERVLGSLGTPLVGLLTVLVLIVWMTSMQPAGAQTVKTIPAANGQPADDGEMAGSGDTANNESLIPTQNLWRILKTGGFLMIPITLCSVIMVAFVFERLVSLRTGRIIPKPFVTRILQQIREGQLDREQALILCEENGSPVAEIFAGGIRKWGRPAVEVEQGILDAGERATFGLRRYLRVFNTVYTISPLLGLLGTVTGMIRAFNTVAQSDALGRPELLASGISEALLTTAAGLTVAIPALLFYLYFTSRVDRLVIEMDSLGQELVHMISAEDLQNRQKPRSPSKPSRTTRVEPTP
jgi:biopolymer transport protein ExbB